MTKKIMVKKLTNYSYDDYIIDITKSNNLSEVRFKLDDDPYSFVILFIDKIFAVNFLYSEETGYYTAHPDDAVTYQEKYLKATTFSLYDDEMLELVDEESISLIRPDTKELIATAQSMVVNGRSTTINIVFEEGKSFTPGQTYTIYGNYLENDNYEESGSVGELEIQKRTTNTVITLSNQSTNVGETIILNMAVKDLKQNSVSRGIFTVYDGSSVIQSNVQITGASTSIPLTFSTAGVHDIWCVYHDTMSEYNDSTSNHENITVNKISTIIEVNNTTQSLAMNETTIISGTLKTGTMLPLANTPIYLINYDNTTLATANTNNDGEFSFNYTLNDANTNNQYIHVKYAGSDRYNTTTQNIQIILHNNTPLPITKAEFYNNTNWGNGKAQCEYDSVEDTGLLILDGSEEEFTVDDYYTPVSLPDLVLFQLNFTLTSELLEGYSFGYIDPTTQEFYGVMAFNQSYAKWDGDLGPDDAGNYQPLIPADEPIPVSMSIVDNPSTGGYHLQISINNGTNYTMNIPATINAQNAHLQFVQGKGMLIVELTDVIDYRV